MSCSCDSMQQTTCFFLSKKNRSTQERVRSACISHLQNINFYLAYIIIINCSETRNINPVDWSSHFQYILHLHILIVTRLGLDAVWNTFSNICHHICPTWFESTYIGPCLQFFGRNPGWSPMTDIQVLFAPWGPLIMTDLLVGKSGNVL